MSNIDFIQYVDKDLDDLIIKDQIPPVLLEMYYLSTMMSVYFQEAKFGEMWRTIAYHLGRVFAVLDFNPPNNPKDMDNVMNKYAEILGDKQIEIMEKAIKKMKEKEKVEVAK